mmetsp:Transcript_5864/g.9400  ORF Transcript_5864/g.9400 Transcript_5864/m.9400 type:complete len:250 (-) Transcript_5864:300-1049(-)
MCGQYGQQLILCRLSLVLQFAELVLELQQRLLRSLPVAKQILLLPDHLGRGHDALYFFFVFLAGHEFLDALMLQLSLLPLVLHISHLLCHFALGLKKLCFVRYSPPKRSITSRGSRHLPGKQRQAAAGARIVVVAAWRWVQGREEARRAVRNVEVRIRQQSRRCVERLVYVARRATQEQLNCSAHFVHGRTRPCGARSQYPSHHSSLLLEQGHFVCVRVHGRLHCLRALKVSVQEVGQRLSDANRCHRV